MAVERGGLAFNLEFHVTFDDHASAVNRTGTRVADASDRAAHYLARTGSGFHPPTVRMYIVYPDNSPHISSPE